MNSLGAIAQNLLSNRKRYRTHSQAVIIACYYNPENNPYRLLAFQHWYKSIKHLNHRIIELTIGKDTKRQLPQSPYIYHQQADTLLWHKETLLNQLITILPREYKYVFWVDTDVIFTNLNWLTDSVAALASTATIVQPFEYCIHLEKGQLAPTDLDVPLQRFNCMDPKRRHPRVWRSFAANHATLTTYSCDPDYDKHGHVGFAWGARREVLDNCPLYDKALVGTADHIMAHAAAGHLNHHCILKAFGQSVTDIHAWSCKFYRQTVGHLGYAPGDLYHIWHGDLKAREYLKRTIEFDRLASEVKDRDRNGNYTATGEPAAYLRRYYNKRERTPREDFGDLEPLNDFAQEMGYEFAAWLAGNPQPDPIDPETIPIEQLLQERPGEPTLPERIEAAEKQYADQHYQDAINSGNQPSLPETAPPPHEPVDDSTNFS